MKTIIILLLVSGGVWIFFKLEELNPTNQKSNKTDFRSQLNHELSRLKNYKSNKK